jgi:hypothetical protein
MGPTLTGKIFFNCLGYLEKELGTNDYLVANTFALGTRSPRVQNSRATDNGAARLVRFIEGLRGVPVELLDHTV